MMRPCDLSLLFLAVGFISFAQGTVYGVKSIAAADEFHVPLPQELSKRHHIYSIHKKKKWLRRKTSEDAIARDVIAARESKLRGSNWASRKNYDEVQRLINCKVATSRSTIQSRYVLCNGKRHKVSQKIRKILRELGTRRDIFPVSQNQDENVGTVLYGKPISSFLDDPSLPQTSSISPHQKYPKLGLFDPGLHATLTTSPGEVLDLPSDTAGKAANQPEAPGEDTPQLPPPEQINADIGSSSSKSEEPKEDLKKKFGLDRSGGDNDDDDDEGGENSDQRADLSSDQEAENQYRVMQASKLNKGEVSDIENFLHETNEEASSDSNDNFGATHYGAVPNENADGAEPKYGGRGPEENKDAAVSEALSERVKDAVQISKEEQKALAEQTVRESEEEKIKSDASSEAENSASKDSVSSVNNEANTLGTAGVASDDEMPAAPIGSIWNSLQNTFYATTQSQLGEIDPTSNTIGRQRVHKPLLHPHVTRITKPVHNNGPAPKTSFHRKVNERDFRASNKSLKVSVGSKRHLESTVVTKKVKKSDISKNEEALVPLDVVRNLLLQSKDVDNSTDSKSKHEKRTKVDTTRKNHNSKRYFVSASPKSSFPPSFPFYGRPNFMPLSFPEHYIPMANPGSMFPAPFSYGFPNFAPTPGVLSSRDGIYPTYHSAAPKEEHGYFRDQIAALSQPFSDRDNMHISNQFAPFFSPVNPSASSAMSFFTPSNNRGTFRGFVSVPIVEPVPLYRTGGVGYQVPLSHSAEMPSLPQLALFNARPINEFESMTRPQLLTPPGAYRDPPYNPLETEEFQPEGQQPDARPAMRNPAMRDPIYREALQDAEAAHRLAMGHTRQYNHDSNEEQENQGAERGYKRSEEKSTKETKTESDSTSGGSTMEKKDGKIVFTKEHIGFGPIVVEAKTANAPLKDDDDDNDED